MATRTPAAQPELLDTATLARISSMQVLARTVVEGFILGLHRSPFRGFSVEFAEYRSYVPGDDIKHLDWKAYARSDKYYIKLFEEETNLACHVVLDASGSMGYSGSQPMSKLQYAARLAACLSYLMSRQRDAAGLVTFDADVIDFLPAQLRQSGLQRVFHTLESIKPGKETDLARPLHNVAEAIKRRGLVVLISDLLGEVRPMLDALQHLKFTGHDILVLQILDPDELEFPFDKLTEFTDLETGEKLKASGRSAKAVYLERFNAHQAAIRDGLAAMHIDHDIFATNQPLDFALAEYLYRRSKAG